MYEETTKHAKNAAKYSKMMKLGLTILSPTEEVDLLRKVIFEFCVKNAIAKRAMR